MEHTSRAARSNDPWRTGVLYCAQLLHIDPSEPLYGINYYGQVVRAGSAEDVSKARWKAEVYEASREHKQVGFLAALHVYGEAAFEWTIAEHREGRRTEMQAYADAGEKRLIAEAGGPLRDMDKRLHQTLNQTKGGSGNARWVGIDAFRKKIFMRFKTEMEAYVKEYDSSLVEQSYVNPLTGYNLGSQLCNFRQGMMRDGSPDKEVIEAWANALPKWAWKAMQTKEYREANAKHCRELMTNETAEAKTARIAKIKVTVNKPENLAARSKRASEQWDNETAEAKAARIAKMKATVNKAESLAASAKRTREWHENETEEAKAERLAKTTVTMNKPENLAANAKRQIEWYENATAEAKAEAQAKKRATYYDKTAATLAGLAGKALESRKKVIERGRCTNARYAAHLKLYQAANPGAKRADMFAAKREGWKPPTTVV